MRPSIFIGSSSEGLPYAKAIEADLSSDADVNRWEEGLFLLGTVTLTELLTFPYRFDFAILVLTPDDVAVSRGVKSRVARDNVLFELGVFMSTLGRGKTYVVTTSKDLKLPSDLAGLTLETIDAPSQGGGLFTLMRRPGKSPEYSDGNLETAVKPACDAVRAAMQRARTEPVFGLLPSTALARGYFENFVSKVCSSFWDPDTKWSRKRYRGEAIPVEKPVDDAKLVIVLPDHFGSFSHDRMKALQQQRNSVWTVTVESPDRPFPFYTYLRNGQDTFEFFDIPTTLATSLNAVNSCLPGVGDEIRDEVKRREIANFRHIVELRAKDFPHRQMIQFADESYFDSFG